MNQKEVKVTLHSSENSRTIRKTNTIVDGIIDKFVDRAEMGKKKYGTDMDRGDLSLYEWIENFQEELHDAILYLEKIKVIIGGNKK
jgi:hypothetical protein